MYGLLAVPVRPVGLSRPHPVQRPGRVPPGPGDLGQDQVRLGGPVDAGRTGQLVQDEIADRHAAGDQGKGDGGPEGVADHQVEGAVGELGGQPRGRDLRRQGAVGARAGAV